MVLEHANGAFRLIVTMHVLRDELESGVPLEGDCLFIGGAGFVVQELEISRESLGHQMSYNGVVPCNAVAVALGYESLLENEVVVGVEGNHDILVDRACSDREAARVVGEELAEWFCDDKDLVGRRCNGRRWNG